MDVDSGGSTAFPTPPPSVFAGGLTWSPDGTAIAVSADTGIAVVGLDGGLQRYVSHGLDVAPVWSPEGTRIAFGRYFLSYPGPSGYELWIAAADGSEQQSVQSGVPLAWSPDATRLLVGQIDGTLMIVQSASDLIIIVPGTSAIWSRDGATLTLLTGLEVARLQADGTGYVQVTHNSMVAIVGSLMEPVLRPR